MQPPELNIKCAVWPWRQIFLMMSNLTITAIFATAILYLVAGSLQSRWGPACPPPRQMPGTLHLPAGMSPWCWHLSLSAHMQERPEVPVPPLLSYTRVCEPFLALSCLHTQMQGIWSCLDGSFLWAIKVAPPVPPGSGKALDQLFPCVIWRFLPGQALSTGATSLAPPLWGLWCFSPNSHEAQFKEWGAQCVWMLVGAKHSSPEIGKERSSCKGRLSWASLPLINKSVSLYWAPLPAHTH